MLRNFQIKVNFLNRNSSTKPKYEYYLKFILVYINSLEDQDNNIIAIINLNNRRWVFLSMLNQVFSFLKQINLER